MKTIEDNKLIAEFMGLSEPYELPQHGTIRPNGHFKTEFTKEQLRYHSSWDWLMPVVEKIESLNMELLDDISYVVVSFDVSITYGDCMITDDKDGTFVSFMNHSIDSNNKLGATYGAVVEFIKWYNKQK